VRLYVQVDGERHAFVGNMAKVFEQLRQVAEGKTVRVLTVFYDSTKEKRRFKREWREAGKDLLRTAQNYLAWWQQVQGRKLKRQQKRA